MEIISIRLSSPFARFKTFYSTASEITHLIPPPTTTYGFIAAVIGYEKPDFFGVINRHTVLTGIEVLSAIRLITHTVNHVNTKSSKGNTVPTSIQFLRYPEYRLYLSFKDKDLQEKFLKRLERREFYYTPYLGNAKNIASVEFERILKAQKVEADTVKTACCVPADCVKKITFQAGVKASKDTLPVDCTTDFIREYRDIVIFHSIDRNAPDYYAEIEVNGIDAFKAEGEEKAIIFLNQEKEKTRRQI